MAMEKFQNSIFLECLWSFALSRVTKFNEVI